MKLIDDKTINGLKRAASNINSPRQMIYCDQQIKVIDNKPMNERKRAASDIIDKQMNEKMIPTLMRKRCLASRLQKNSVPIFLREIVVSTHL